MTIPVATRAVIVPGRVGSYRPEVPLNVESIVQSEPTWADWVEQKFVLLGTIALAAPAVILTLLPIWF